jgi:L-lactate utilization protein LutC
MGYLRFRVSLLFFCALLGTEAQVLVPVCLAQTTPVSRCEALFLSAKAVEGRQTVIDLVKAGAFIAANEPEDREALRWMVDHIEVIPGTTIIDEVLQAFQRLKDSVQPTEVAFLVEAKSDDNRSGAWITGAVQNRYPEFRQARVFTSAVESIRALRGLLESKPHLHVVIADDMAYSGTQLWDLARSINPQKDLVSRVHIVIARASSRGRSATNPYASIHAMGSIPLVSELLDKVDDVQRQEHIRSSIRTLSKMHAGWAEAYENQTLTTPTYRMVDEFSFPNILYSATLMWPEVIDGKVYRFQAYNADGEAIYMPFIRGGMPPYKLVPRVALEE